MGVCAVIDTLPPSVLNSFVFCLTPCSLNDLLVFPSVKHLTSELSPPPPE